MAKALEAKFRAYKDIYEILIDSGDSKIVEDSPLDSYWGNGRSGTGKNRIGVLLMELREKFIDETQ